MNPKVWNLEAMQYQGLWPNMANAMSQDKSWKLMNQLQCELNQRVEMVQMNIQILLLYQVS